MAVAGAGARRAACACHAKSLPCSFSGSAKGLCSWLQGCGKTIEVLALVMANPAPPLTIPRGTIDQSGLMHSQCAHRQQTSDVT